MHGVKTRRIEQITNELKETIQAHRRAGTIFGGVHLELTHEPVTECLGGGDFVQENDLPRRYETWCDPRLNRNQSLELAFDLSEMLGSQESN
jgi:3-deoxy-7-phosphoheptulonate synthase